MGPASKPTADDLILRIYDTALDSAVWPELLNDIAHFCNARGAFLFELQGEGQKRVLNAVRHSSYFVPEIVRDYLALHHDDELADQEFFATRSQMTDEIDLIPDDELAGLLKNQKTGGDVFSRPHMQMQMKFGIKHRAGALLNKDDRFRDRLALQFGVDHGPVRPEDRHNASLLMPHLAKAIQLSRPSNMAQRQYNSIAQAVNHLKIGVCILDNRARVVFRNAEFDRQIEQYRAFRVAQDGKLSFNQDKFDRSVADLLGHYSQHGKFGARPRKEAVATVLDEDSTFALCVEVAPLPSAEGFGEMALDGHILYSLDTSQSFKVRTDVLRDLFELTRSEAEVVGLMAEGLTNQQISDQRTKSIHTINTQVKSILSKTQASNRTQLIRLATNLSTTLVDEG